MRSPALAAARHEAHAIPESHRAASFALAIGVFGIGWSAILVRWSGVSGMVSAFYRLAFAALVLLPWYFVRQRGRVELTVPLTTRAKRRAIFAGVVFAADLAFFNSSIMITSAANATLLGVNAPVFVAIGAWLLYGQRPTARFWLGFSLAMAGVIAIVGTDVVIHPKLGFGDILAVVGALCYGIYLLYVPRARLIMDTLTFSTWSVCAGALSLLPVCLVARRERHPRVVRDAEGCFSGWFGSTGDISVAVEVRLEMDVRVDPTWEDRVAAISGFSTPSWASLIALALVTQVMGHFCVAYALGHLPVTMTSVVLLAQAPITAILAWPLLGEPVRLAQVVGGGLVLVGILVVNLTRLPASTRVTARQRA